jgi:lathosterol oxidase
MSWLVCAGISLLVSVVTFWGLGGLVHWWFYVHRRAEAHAWKLQPERWLNRTQMRQALWLGGFNLALGSLAGGTFTWYLSHGGWSAIYFDARRFGVAWLAASVLVGLIAVDAGLYYSHRLLHHRRLFRFIHRWHHRFVAPTVFTTTAMHPIEFLIFLSFLLLPAFVIPMHVGAYLIVIGYTYFIGVIDHLGVRVNWKLPLHGDNRFHDDHHVHFHCNYGHHTALFDRLHGTVRRLDRHYDEHTWGAPRPVEQTHAR